jgi:light-regulated signal transduction histidine kinase (bacteriophytochrome)
MLKDRVATTLDQDAREILENISISAGKMNRLINDLLTFARMARVEMHKTRINMTSLVQDALHDLAGEMEGRAIEWLIGPLDEADGDPAMLRHALMNLISNALKYTRDRAPARIEIGCTSTDAENVFFIRDNGAGFDMANAGKLFGVFHRLHRSDEFEGTGIGLANVRRIIERHGGHAWGEGVVNQGATFYFSLPRQSRG